MCLIGTDAMYPVLKTASPGPLNPIYTPTDCEQKGNVYSSSGVYIKSYCIDMYSRNFEDSRMNCLGRGMRIYQHDSTEATATILDAATKQWTNNFYYNELYSGGSSGVTCTNINNKNPFGPVSKIIMGKS